MPLHPGRDPRPAHVIHPGCWLCQSGSGQPHDHHDHGWQACPHCRHPWVEHLPDGCWYTHPGIDPRPVPCACRHGAHMGIPLET